MSSGYHQTYRGLPRELRDQVYEHLFTSDGSIHIMLRSNYVPGGPEQFTHILDRPKAASKILFAIFLTNKEMSAEALSILYSKSTFEFGTLDYKYALHPDTVRSFFFGIPKIYRQSISHIVLGSRLLAPKKDLRRGPPRTFESPIKKHDEFTSSLLRFLTITSRMKLETLTVNPHFENPIAYDKHLNESRETSFRIYGHPILRATNLEMIRSAILAGDLGALKWDYSTAKEFFKGGKWHSRQYWGSFQSGEFSTGWDVYPHCVALAFYGFNSHTMTDMNRCGLKCLEILKHLSILVDGNDAGLMIEWEDWKDEPSILVVRKRKENEAEMKAEAYKALSEDWINAPVTN